MNKLPGSVQIPYSGSVAREGAMLVPHSMAFPSAMMSLRVLMGLAHDVHIIQMHGRSWRADHDYNLYVALSGEGFRFLFDAAEFFRFALPEGAQPVRDCLGIAGIPARILSNVGSVGADGGWASVDALRALVLGNLAAGFPVLLLGRTRSDRVLLAVGYEDGGDTLVAWTFAPGSDMTNKSFAVADCQYIQNWLLGTDAAVLVDGPPVQPSGGEWRAILLRGLERGERLLRDPVCAPYGERVNYYDHWIDRLRDEPFWAGAFEGFPFIYPEIWDLAERRLYVSAFLERAGEELGMGALAPGIEAGRAIHDGMWSIHALIKGEEGAAALKSPAVRAQIAQILVDCRRLDGTMADAIGRAGKRIK